MRYFVSILIAVLFVSCEESPVVKSVQLDEEFTLSAGDSVILNDLQLSLKVESINDSRCPDGAECIWAGSADVIVTFESQNTGILVDTLRSFNNRIIVLTEYSIQLLDVRPYPALNKKLEDKEARILITKN
jgi:hypothetical protein